ncbi:MAG: MFS transporter [Acidimicrobiia bacterium]|nr:MFS transporter [Acidimicrobiia bacterium]
MDIDARRGSLLVLVVATCTSVLTGPGQTIVVSVFIDHFVDDLSLSRAQVSGAYLIGTLVGAALLPFVGRLIDWRGVRSAQIVIGFAFALALVNMSRVTGLVTLAIGFTGIRFLGQGSLSLVSIVTVSLRFLRNRGTALGVFSTVSAGGMALLPLALAVVIDDVGWRDAWLISAGVVAMTVVPMAVFGLREMPRGTAGLDATMSNPDDERTVHFERSRAIRTRGFWMLAAVTGCSGMLATALNFHQIDLLGEAGLSTSEAAALFVPQVIGSTIAGLAVGWISDRIGVRFLPAAGMGLLVIAHLLAAIVTPGIIVIAYAIVLGAMGGAVRTVAAVLLPRWFGTRHLGSIQGALTFLGVAGSALGPVALALVEGGFGSYRPAVLVLAVLPVAVMLFALVDVEPRIDEASGT